MHVLITDSGVGGLSVCAYAERWLREHGSREPVRLTFANAAPENDYGYNSMPTREEKLETFDRFLRNVTDRCEPDSIYVACNTLSVLLPDVPFVTRSAVPVRGIVETAVDQIMQRHRNAPESAVIVFGTPTTIEAGTYPRLLEARGFAPGKIVSQSCPGLADVISEDRKGERTSAEIERWVHAAIERLTGEGSSVIACLACTHYGYRRDLFAEAFARLGISAEVVNPNEDAVDDLSLPKVGDGTISRETPVRFITRYRILPTTLETLTFFLEEISPRTVRALHEFEYVPELF